MFLKHLPKFPFGKRISKNINSKNKFNLKLLIH
uniref:ORF32 n=1 Tax=Beta vulgaris subsp. vulgaris TaxID=3555 RepID=Q31736_BETVV|nr:unnamed protein product [Beta vulgaris subsp. vulgaris]